MQITYSPSALPGSCFFCGSGNRNSYIDTGQSVEFHGAMYICEICVNEMARMYSYISQKEYADLKDQLDRLETQRAGLQIRVTALEESLRVLGDAGYMSVVDDDADPFLGDFPPTIELSNEESSSGEESVGVGAGKALKSGHDFNLARLHTDEPELTDESEF